MLDLIAIWSIALILMLEPHAHVPAAVLQHWHCNAKELHTMT